MSIAKSSNKDCQEEVCEVNFHPTRTHKSTFENLKSIAGNIIEKVKETMSGDNHNGVTEESIDQTVKRDQSAEKNQISTVRDKTVALEEDEEGQHCISRRSTEILSRFVQESWQPLSQHGQSADSGTPFRLEHVKPRPPENMVKAPRYSNPWRYDSHH